MSIDWLRDLFIIIFSIVATVILIFIGVVTVSIYRRAKQTLDAIQTTAAAVQSISIFIKNEVGGTQPIIRAITLLQGLREGLEIFYKLFKKRRGG